MIERLLKGDHRIVGQSLRQESVNHFGEKGTEKADQFMIRDGRKWEDQ